MLTRNVDKLYAQSKTIAQRLRDFGDIDSEVLYPPPPERPYRTEGYESFVFAVSRLHSLKRLDLLVKAMKHVKTDIRAVIAGTGEEEDTLKALAGELGVAERVDFVGRVDDDTLVDYYARCRGVFFAPYMEDYGFVTLEAFRSKKPVMTCMDSGGPAELVSVGPLGLRAPPRADANSDAARRLVGQSRARDPHGRKRRGGYPRRPMGPGGRRAPVINHVVNYRPGWRARLGKSEAYGFEKRCDMKRAFFLGSVLLMAALACAFVQGSRVDRDELAARIRAPRYRER